MIKLGVNIDHIATIRQARRTYEPEPLWAAIEAQLAGADGITIHLREDRRHIQDSDVIKILENISIKVNLEMAATPAMLKFALAHQPHMAMLVPEGRQEITTEGGLNICHDEKNLSNIIDKLLAQGISCSVFIDAESEQIEAAARIGAQVCEIHTGPYAHAFYQNGRTATHPKVITEINKIKRAAEKIIELGMEFNAGHALNYANVSAISKLANLRELHIGHAIVSRAVFVGLRQAIIEMKNLIN